MTSTRDLVLQNLMDRQRCTINELAEAVEINPISVRHHIGKLQAEGLVNSKNERHGVGRPRSVYFLSEKGMEQFPARTIRLTSKLIGQLKQNLPPEKVDAIFKGMGDSLRKAKKAKIEQMSLDERLNLIDKWLQEEGFGVQIEKTSDEILIRETSCPYYHVGQEHAEVCGIDRELINSVLNTKAERTTCLLHGDSHCTYVVPMDAVQINA